jgi:hypothetical protein
MKAFVDRVEVHGQNGKGAEVCLFKERRVAGDKTRHGG